ncbi:MAG TPA: 2Fe-2S iron-sulfur cluster-binding protein [Candidatus Dormibacteraeota bacterium]|nr:2Fe-2S iron-sulfur cluster-binding protein [Candidatus Dormibacteraeota bacterium]
MPPRLTLADLLRDHLQLTGTHLGCEQGVCGACTILCDGEAVRSCLMLAVQADGRSLTTVEGLDDDPDAAALRDALVAGRGLQCGFCTPGVLLSAMALRRADPPIDPARVRELLAGNICRCTGYEPIIDAVRAWLG